ncbi:hypothetical protein [Nocardia acididurans]|uniref:hypothetical protein n=1 Tax=Nocardia acididurans TaxID=2802282 RepID=UPI001E3F93AE|nr:hypothetical protein [Nocardia acididurans]
MVGNVADFSGIMFRAVETFDSERDIDNRMLLSCVIEELRHPDITLDEALERACYRYARTARCQRDEDHDRDAVVEHFQALLAALRAPTGAHSLHAHRNWAHDHEFLELAGQALKPFLGINERPLIQCPHHGYTEPLGQPLCQACPCELPLHRGPGRPARYCSPACRQRAARRRAAHTASAVGAVEHDS